MRYRKLDSAGDMLFGHQLQDFFIDDSLAVAQAVKTRLALWLGEWYLDLEDGTPWQNGILGKGTDVTADALLRRRILETEGVVEIVDGTYFSTLDRDTRTLSVACTIETIDGTAQVSA